MTSHVDARNLAAPGGPSVTEYLSDDHRRLDAILSEVEGAVSAGAFRVAEARFAEFALGLGRHIDAEEGILFPVFEQMTGMKGGPTLVMRSEHAQIRLLMKQAAGALAADDGARWEASFRELANVLATHNMKEERILYPMTDQAASDQARHDLVARLRAAC